LARRSEQRPTVFAALQWLRQKPKPRHRIRFDEWVLLVLRVLLVVLLALLLARPVLFGAASDAPFVAVAPGVAAAQAQRIPVGPGGAVALVGAGVSGADIAACDVGGVDHQSVARARCEFAGGCGADRDRAAGARWRGCADSES
jgi:hypothetical protein